MALEERNPDEAGSKRHPEERGAPFDPFRSMPWLISPYVAGRGVFLPGRRHLARRGPFASVGPKGYVRSDERILDDVCDRLAEHPHLDVRDVTVAVADGEVTLEGTVPDRWTKRACEEEADDASGVRDVHNRLRIPAPSTGSRGA